MSPVTFYLMVGVVAAIAGGEDVGCLGMLMLLVAWPVFVLAALAVQGFPRFPWLKCAPARVPDEPDLRVARLRGGRVSARVCARIGCGASP